MSPLGLQKDLVTVFFGEPDDLVFDGRAIARSHPLDHPAIHRGFVKIGPDDIVGLGVV